MKNEALAKSASGQLPVRLVMLGGAVILLLVGVFAFERARAANLRAERALDNVETQLAQAKDRQQLAQRNRVLLNSAQQLQKETLVTKYDPDHWAERQINLKQQNLSRDQVNPLLLSSARSKDQLLDLQEFDLSVTHADDGLFDLRQGSRQPLLLTFRGSLYFKLSERPL
jgi:hypothetical protein